MAFWKTSNHSEGKTCPVCRNRYKKGYTLSFSEETEICADCFKRDYMSKGRNLAMTDTDKNLFTTLRPADVLEKPLHIFKDTKLDLARDRILGYEMSDPVVIPSKITANVLLWCILLAVFRLVCPDTSNGLSAVALFTIQSAVSVVWGLKLLADLIRGFFTGVGYFRKTVLFAATAVMALLAYNGITVLLEIFTDGGFKL